MNALCMVHILRHNNISEFLQEELNNRKTFNSAYSLRAFARDLKVSPSTLSEIISGKKGISKVAAEKMANVLKLGNEEKKCFLMLVDSAAKRTTSTSKKALQFLKDTREQKELTLEVFELISKWHHFTILEALKNTYFRRNTDELCEALNISDAEFTTALLHLQKLQLIDKDLAPTQYRVITPQDLPSSAIRMHHKSILRKAEIALEQQSVEEREFQISHLIFSKQNIPQIKEKIRRFQEELIREFGIEEDKEQSVYCLSTQFFNLTKNTRGQE